MVPPVTGFPTVTSPLLVTVFPSGPIHAVCGVPVNPFTSSNTTQLREKLAPADGDPELDGLT